MFTGLITGLGTICKVTPIGESRDARFAIGYPPDWPGRAGLSLGASIACSGCCLTVVDFDAEQFAVEVSAESLGVTTLGRWRTGTRINLESSLRLGDELGGHLVSGHVDGLAKVRTVTPEHGSTRYKFLLPEALAPFVAPKGSIAINGVSLTVNEVEDLEFGVNIIPHTRAHTDFEQLAAGDPVNIEIDMLARYVARQRAFNTGAV